MHIRPLLERPVNVHVNGQLTVLVDLIKRDFGSELRAIPFDQRCMTAQVAYVLSARTQVPLTDLLKIFATAYNKKLDRQARYKVDAYGVTPQQLFDAYDGFKLVIKDKPYKLKLSFDHYTSVEEIVSAVKEGHPVIVPYNSYGRFSNGANHHSNEGKFHQKFIDRRGVRDPHSSYYHALLAVGVDEGSKEVILRDIRSLYLFKGYVKVPYKAMRNYIKMAFTFDADLEPVQP
jgi:hypothetical protein